MPKYLNKPAIVPGQEAEIFPLLDAALVLPYGKAIVYQTTASRAKYLYRIIQGERYRNAIYSLATYTPEEYLYGKGLYYHTVPDAHPKGLIIANLENPPGSVTWDIIRCVATKKPIPIIAGVRQAFSRLNQLKVKFPAELGAVYVDTTRSMFCYAIPSIEELVIVDIDMNKDLPAPTYEQRAKVRQ
jgi:hypothetical protein